MKSIKKVKEIKKEFEEKWGYSWFAGQDREGYELTDYLDEDKEAIWSWIESTISQTRKEVIEEIKIGIKNKHRVSMSRYDMDQMVGYDFAIDDVSKLLEDLNKK